MIDLSNVGTGEQMRIMGRLEGYWLQEEIGHTLWIYTQFALWSDA